MSLSPQNFAIRFSCRWKLSGSRSHRAHRPDDDSPPPAAAAVTAWALLLAYIATGSSVVGGFVNYGIVIIGSPTSYHVHPTVVAVVFFVSALSGWIAYQDVRISARLMLWIEGISALLIAIVLATILVLNGFYLDLQQLRVQGSSVQGIRLGTVLALFSFLGFESATMLGAEAREPLRTIPRAVLQNALLCGLFFILAAYGETLGYRPTGLDLGGTTAPFHSSFAVRLCEMHLPPRAPMDHRPARAGCVPLPEAGVGREQRCPNWNTTLGKAAHASAEATRSI